MIFSEFSCFCHSLKSIPSRFRPPFFSSQLSIIILSSFSNNISRNICLARCQRRNFKISMSFSNISSVPSNQMIDEKMTMLPVLFESLYPKSKKYGAVIRAPLSIWNSSNTSLTDNLSISIRCQWLLEPRFTSSQPYDKTSYNHYLRHEHRNRIMQDENEKKRIFPLLF